MKNHQAEHMEKRLSDAAKQMIPGDMYSRITQSIAQEERTMNMNTTTFIPTARKKRPMRWISIAAAACLLLACGIFGGNYYSNNLVVDSVVDIDVNPGIEISTNRNDVVLSVTAVNSDAEQVLDGMNLKNTDLKVAVNAIIGSMVKNGYLVNGENSILVTVQNKDEKRATHIRNLILSDIHASLQDNQITASVVNQTVTENADAKELAAAQGISFGKATLILNLCAKDTALSPDTLAKMSIREIAALIVEKNIDIRDIVDYDADDSIWENIQDAVDDTDEDFDADQSATAVSAAKAKEIALAHAGVSPSDASFIRAELDRDDGVQVYEIEFTAGTTEYDYEVDAQTGAILKSSAEALEAAKPPQGPVITADEAKEIALNHAGVSADSATFVKVELDTDDGVQIYDIEFTIDSAAYEYEVHGQTGAVIKSTRYTITTVPASAPPNQLITAAEAKKIALNHAGASADSAAFVKVELDMDDGVQVYEVEFCVGATEYEYEIDAQTGSVIHCEAEVDD